MLKKSELSEIILTYWPVGLAIALMIPRLATAEFGLFDDPAAIRFAQGIEAGDWGVLANDAASGRFRPIYWLQYTLIYMLFGAQPAAFYIWNTAVFAALTAVLIMLVLRLGASREQAWATGLVFVLSGPVVENIYTLMKPELLQSALLIGALLPFASIQNSSLPSSRWLIRVSLGTVLVLSAAMTKETTVLMLPLAGVWLAFAHLSSARNRSPELRRWVGLLAAVGLALAIYFILRARFLDVSFTGGTYSNNVEWSLARLRDSAIRWAGWLVRDYAWLGPLLLIFLGELLQRRVPQGHLLVGAMVWSAAWVAIYLPWEFTVEYYMMPMALGASVIAGILLISAWQRIRLGTSKRLVWLAFALAVPLWVTTLPNNLSNARLQIAVDQANARMLEFLTTNAPPDSAVVVNIQSPNEYIYELQAYLQAIADLPMVSVAAYDPGRGLPEGSGSPVLLLEPQVQNQPLLAVRMGVVEETQRGWNQSLQEAIGPSSPPVFQAETGFRLSIVDLPRVLCILLPDRGYCRADRPLIDTSRFAYGWNVYHWEGDG